MRNSTLLFLVKKDQNRISEICLAMKKRGFGLGRWNGVGGKVSTGESIEDAVKRETFEEIGVQVENISKVAELSFVFPHNPDWDQVVHVYICETWDGDPVESDEMKPEWYSINELPFDKMWPDDPFWLPLVINRERVKGRFVFGEGDVIQEKKVRVVNNL